MDFIDHRSTANFIFGLSATDEKVRITSDGDVGIGVSNPSTKLEVDGTVTADDVSLATKAVIGGATPRIELFESDTTDVNTRFRNTAGTLQIQSTNDAGSTSKTRIVIDHATGDISFREDSGSTAKLYWDASAESLGIGTDSPSTELDVAGTVTANSLTVNSGNTNTTSFFQSTDATADIVVADTNTSNVIRTNAGGLFINTGGNASAQGTGATPTAQFATNGDVSLYEDTGSTAKFYWDASEESLGLGTSSPSATLDVEAGNEAVAIFNRTASGGSSVGSVVEIQRTGTLAGHLGSQANGYFYVGQSATNLAFSDTNNLIFPRGTDGAARDGEINLGNSSNRFKDFYLSGGAYLGGTAAANKLDDYEEGSWTPVLSDGTNTVTLDTKAYTKVGRMVTCTVSTYNKDTSSLSGNIKITGLPFQGLNTDQSVPLYWRDGGDAGDSVFGYLSANSTELNVRENRGSAASATNIAATSTTTIFVTFTYQAS